MKKKMPQWLKVLGTIVLILLVLIGGIGGYSYMKEKRKEALYRHGLRLLEQQTAYYLKEHYSGISKIEFSPIFVDESGVDRSIKVVPVIYDEHGNRALLGKEIGNFQPMTYGYPVGLSTIEIDNKGNDFIEIGTPKDEYMNVSDYHDLPEKAKFSSHSNIDDNIDLLVKFHKIENVKKSSVGNPKVKITYNYEIKKGDYKKWQ